MMSFRYSDPSARTSQYYVPNRPSVLISYHNFHDRPIDFSLHFYKTSPGSFVLSKQKATSLIHKLIALNDHSWILFTEFFSLFLSDSPQLTAGALMKRYSSP